MIDADPESETLSRCEVIPYLHVMNEQLKNFGRNVVFHMKRQKVSVGTLAKRADISPKTLNNIVKGRHAAQIDTLTSIAAALNVELWQLWLPEFPADAGHDETFPRLIDTASKLPASALKAVARVADLELAAIRRG